VEELIKQIKRFNGKSVNPKESVFFAVQSIITGILFGKPINPSEKSDNRLKTLINELPEQFTSLLVVDFWPPLRFLPFIRKHINNSTKCADELFDLLDKKIDAILTEDNEESFVSCFVEKEGKNLDKTQLKGILRDLVAAGTDTVTTTTLWTIVLLANHREVQERLQKEIDSVVPRDRLPSLSDMSKMTYAEATILEIMRYKTVLPIGAPRATLRATEVGGFFIPKKTQVSIL